MSEYQSQLHRIRIEVRRRANLGWDNWTWFRAYKLGYRKPNYPVPARYHVSLDPDGLDTMDILANILFHADGIFYLHDYDCSD